LQQAKEQAEWNAQQKRKQEEEEGQADTMEKAEQFLQMSTAKLTKVRRCRGHMHARIHMHADAPPVKFAAPRHTLGQLRFSLLPHIWTLRPLNIPN
jgi:hypothetical protein